MGTCTAAVGRILIVDDQPANLRVVSLLLARNHYEVLTAVDGDQALAVATEHQPDLVLLDMLMPGMDGFQVIAEFKQNEALMRIPVVCLTAARDREVLVRAFDAGAVDYVTKPFLPEELLARVNAQVGLKLTRDRLERTARERQQLVNLVAHDLKNPLSSVLFAVDILRNNAVREERIPRYLETIQESANDALGYIRHYLETQRDITRTATLEAGVASFNETMQWLDRRYRLQFESSGRQLRTSAAAADLLVSIHAQVLRQVTENLITNAMKYAPDSDVDVSCRSGGPGYCQLLVSDRGPGIDNSRQRELFKPFVRLHDENAELDVNSTGLGLSLAKQIIGNFDGQLWYEDREGGGACFVIELPEAKTGHAPA